MECRSPDPKLTFTPACACQLAATAILYTATQVVKVIDTYRKEGHTCDCLTAAVPPTPGLVRFATMKLKELHALMQVDVYHNYHTMFKLFARHGRTLPCLDGISAVDTVLPLLLQPQDIEPFTQPKVQLEQYPTGADIASRMLYTVSLSAAAWGPVPCTVVAGVPEGMPLLGASLQVLQSQQAQWVW